MTNTMNPTTILNAVADAMMRGQFPDALRMLQKSYPTPKGWVPGIERNAPTQWQRSTRQIVSQRNGVLYAGSRDWFTKTAEGLHIADQVNALPASGQYVLRQTASHTALVSPRPRRLLPEEPAFLIGSNGNYYHWLLDYLPRVPLALSQDPIARLIIGDCLAPFEMETLTGLGVRMDQLVRLGRHCVSPYRRLYIPDLGSNNRSPHPETLRWLRSMFQVKTGRGPRHIWLSRSRASSRRVLNEEYAIESLKPFGFESVVLDGRSVIDQAQIFSSSDIIIGPHGAGFSNIVFAPEGAHIIELAPGMDKPIFFQALSQACGIAHSFIQCRPSPSEIQLQREHPRNWDMIVNIPDMLMFIKRIL